jgi:septal ring factor EnvC (AmiA/AmiB activator)
VLRYYGLNFMLKETPGPQKFINWIGSTTSLIIHSLVFAVSFALVFLGVPVDKVLLVLTTAVSLEAIYLAIFIQMTVNSNTQSLQEVEEDIDEIQEDVEGIEKDIDEIQEDVDKLEEDEAEDDLHDAATMKTLDTIQNDLQKLMQDIQNLKEQKK